jgi:hypothetical protein
VEKNDWNAHAGIAAGRNLDVSIGSMSLSCGRRAHGEAASLRQRRGGKAETDQGESKDASHENLRQTGHPFVLP